jgi:hypothetical protein
MSTQTHIAYCGACAGHMVLIHDYGVWWFLCQDCGLTTEPRATAQLADDDAVWVPVKDAKKLKESQR